MCFHTTKVEWCQQDGGHIVPGSWAAHEIIVCRRAAETRIPPILCRDLRVQHPPQKVDVYKCEGCRSRFGNYDGDDVRELFDSYDNDHVRGSGLGAYYENDVYSQFDAYDNDHVRRRYWDDL